MQTNQSYLNFALHLADQSRKLILELWNGSSIDCRVKKDQTPVTNIDLETEQLLRMLIAKSYPEHAIIGEEYPNADDNRDFVWTLDPIDGTQNLVNHIPTFGTLIGLRHKGQAIVGVIDHPALDLRTYGGTGLGVFRNGKPINLPNLPDDHFKANDLLITNCLSVWQHSPEGASIFNKLVNSYPHLRIYYDCYAHSLACTGSVAAVVEPCLQVWDLTPAEALIPEAGGKFVYLPTTESGQQHAIFGKATAVELVQKNIEL